MLKSLLRMFGSSGGEKPPVGHGPYSAPKAAPAEPTPAGVPIYPPTDQGISFGGARSVVLTQQEMVKRLRLLSGMPEAEFQRLYGAVLNALANYIDLLPASESGTHMGAGGLFRLCLELGFFSRQACEGVLFAGRAGVENRRNLEPRWRYATFLAGLCCELHRPLSQMLILNDAGDQWQVHRTSLAEWMAGNPSKRYFVRWVTEGEFTGGSATLLASRIIPETSLQYLQEGHGSIIPTMLDAIIGDVAKAKENQILEVVDRMRRKVLERDKILAPQHYGKLTVGNQLEPHLIDAMRQLVASGAWTVNVKKARVWYGADGMYVVWRTAAKEIIETLERGKVSGIPRDATTIAEILLKAGVLQSDAQNDLYWKIKTPLSENELVAVKLTNPETLLVAVEEERPAALADKLASGAGAATQAPAAKVPPVVTPSADVAPPACPPPPAQKPEAQAGEPPPKQSDNSGDAGQSSSATPDAQGVPQDGGVKPRTKPPQPKAAPEEVGPGAIQSVQESVPEPLPEDAAKQMSKSVRCVVAQMAQEFRAGALGASAGECEYGLAFDLEVVGGYGIELTKVLAELHGLGWLYSDPSNPRKKIHLAKIGNNQVQSAIFKRQVAVDLGFIRE